MSGKTSPDRLEMMTMLRTAAIGPTGPLHFSELPRSGLVQILLSVVKIRSGEGTFTPHNGQNQADKYRPRGDK